MNGTVTVKETDPDKWSIGDLSPDFRVSLRRSILRSIVKMGDFAKVLTYFDFVAVITA